MSQLRPLFVLLLVLTLTRPTPAQTVHPQLTAAFQHVVDSMRTVLGVKGLSAAVQIPNDAVWAGASGISALSPLDSLTPEHAFAIGSTTKMLTAACVLQLADEGLLNLDDSLHAWLPDFQYINPNITIRQLLQHRSGIYDVLQNTTFQPTLLADKNKLWSLPEVINTFIKPAVFSPGSAWAYSNTNYLLLGMIIETATGKTYGEEIRSRFLTPMQLDGFSLQPFEPLPDQVAHLWLDITGDGIADDAFDFLSTWHSFFSATAPAGAYLARPSDMARWVRRFGSGMLFLPSTWAQATTTVTTNMPGGTRYGLGLMERKFLGLTGYGHGGDLSYSSSVFYFPAKDLGIAVHCNDGKVNSWGLASTVSALLKAYLDNEPLLTGNQQTPENGPEISVTPNPFTESISVSIGSVRASDALTVDLFDVAGKKIAGRKYDNMASDAFHFSLRDLEPLPAGVYYLSLEVNGIRTAVKKLIKRAPF